MQNLDTSKVMKIVELVLTIISTIFALLKKSFPDISE